MVSPAPATTLVPVDALLEYLGIGNPGEAETNRATLCVEAARSTLERFCGRSFTTTTETRFFDVPVNTTELRVGDFQNITELAARSRFDEAYRVLAADAYRSARAAPHRPFRSIRRVDGYRFRQGTDNVRVNATWGMTLPADAEVPILMEAAYLFQANKAPAEPI